MVLPTSSMEPSAPARGWRARIGKLLMFAGLVTLICGGTFGVQRAGAILHDIQETGLPGYLSLRSAPVDPFWKDLSPGTTVHWMIEASLDDAPSSTLALEMRSSGPLADTGQLHVEVTSCTAPSENISTVPLCTSGGTLIVAPQPLSHISSTDDGTVFPLARLTAEAPRHLLVSLSVPAAETSLSKEITQIGVGLTATGEDAPVIPEAPTLAATGTDVTILGLLTGGILLIGAGAVTLRRAPTRGGDV